MVTKGMFESRLESLRVWLQRVLAGFTNGQRPGAGPEPLREDAFWSDPPLAPTTVSRQAPDSLDFERAGQMVALMAGLGESVQPARAPKNNQ